MLKTFKRHTINALALMAISASFGQAFAANVQVDGVRSPTDQYRITSSFAELAFKASVFSALPTAGITFSGVAPATFNASTTTITTNIPSFNYDDVSKQFLSLQSVGGGNFNMPQAKTVLFVKVGGPGTVSLTDFAVDFSRKVLTANAFGANGLVSGKRDIFSFSSFEGPTTFTGAGTYNFKTTDLLLTSSAIDAISQGLALSSTGRNVFANLGSLGTLSGTMAIEAFNQPIPEPSTWALMGLGLLAVGATAKRQAKHRSTHQ